MKLIWIGAGLVALLLFSIAIGVAIGGESISPGEILRVLWHLASLGQGPEPDAVAERIVWRLRLPRVLLAALTGGGLAVVGVAMQALVRNPLAEPYILGISSGASAGASLFYLGFLPPVLSTTVSMPIAAFFGGLLAITLVYVVARTGSSVSIARLLLAGVAVSALMAAVTSLITLASPDLNRTRAVLFWLLGSFNNTRWGLLPLPAVASVAGAVLLFLLSRPLDALLMGEEPAQSLGFPVETLKRVLLVMAALVTGMLVASAGVIGFVGLIIPHAVRSLAGVSHIRVLPFSFLGGAIFLVWSDLMARILLPAQELPVGIITAVCGVPFFLFLLRRRVYHFG
jgi:iron complex transport system permease protein